MRRTVGLRLLAQLLELVLEHLQLEFVAAALLPFTRQFRAQIVCSLRALLRRAVACPAMRETLQLIECVAQAAFEGRAARGPVCELRLQAAHLVGERLLLLVEARLVLLFALILRFELDDCGVRGGVSLRFEY